MGTNHEPIRIISNGYTKIRHKNGRVQKLKPGDELINPDKDLLKQAGENPALVIIKPEKIPGGKENG